MSLADKVKETLNEVLDIKPEEVQDNAKLDESLGVDSTEMVEVTVALKKKLGVEIAGNDIKKTNTLNEIVDILKEKVEAE